jgi:hypothetical protein
MVVEPAGGFAVGLVVPTPPEGWPLLACADPPCGQGGMLISMSLRCLARITVRTPGVWSALAIGSVEELLLELLLEPPHAPSAVASAATATSPRPARATELLLPAISSPSVPRSIVTGCLPRRAPSGNHEGVRTPGFRVSQVSPLPSEDR